MIEDKKKRENIREEKKKMAFKKLNKIVTAKWKDFTERTAKCMEKKKKEKKRKKRVDISASHDRIAMAIRARGSRTPRIEPSTLALMDRSCG